MRVVTFFLIFVFIRSLPGQADPTAKRKADLQIGIGFVGVNSDYDPTSLKGVAAYATLDVTSHLGAEFVVHQTNSSSGDSLYQRTYEIGPRYHRTYGHFLPYVKGMYGRGVFNFPNGVANLAYNMFSGGVGSDISVLRFLNLRVDYEYQRWLTFPPTGLAPQVLTIGVAYHFPGEMRMGSHYR